MSTVYRVCVIYYVYVAALVAAIGIVVSFVATKLILARDMKKTEKLENK